MEGAPGLAAHSAQLFVEKYRNASSEKQLAQSFWRDFFTSVGGVADLLACGIEFEYPVRSSTTHKVGFVDVLWPGVVLVEHKSAGEDLDKAEKQARDYLASLEPAKRPPVIIACDFHRLRVVEVLAGSSVEFALEDLPHNLNRIEAILEAGGAGAARVEVEADAKAAELMSDLFVAFEDAGYGGHEVSVFLVRVLLLLFGDDTSLWKRAGDQGLFEALVSGTPENGSGLGGVLQELFQTLNQRREERPKSLPASLSAFPYVNGGLYRDPLPVFSFTPEMRDALLAACRYDWSGINPSIFGAMFQAVKSREARRELGQHYTSEANILKLIGPLFLDEMNDRLRKVWDSPTGLRRFQQDLGTYVWADCACGAGNFLLVAYKKVRDLELRATARLFELQGTRGTAIDATWLLNVSLSRFYGIEYDEWSSQIASVAMFLAEHQANLEMERVLGVAPEMLPLADAPTIVTGNALRMEWEKFFPVNDRTFIFGNPPFYGTTWQNPEQKEDTRLVWQGVKSAGMLDYVSNWFHKAAEMSRRYGARAALVATSSITQGEQPPILWGQLLPMGIHIDFAHRPFRWSNDAPGQAAVFTVIVGFSGGPPPAKAPLWSYATPDAAPELRMAKHINGYLLDGPDVLVTPRTAPLSPSLPRMDYGNKPTDDGLLSNLSPEEAEAIRRSDPTAAKYLRLIVGGRELIHGQERWCLWLPDADPADIRSSPELLKRISGVQAMRAASKKKQTRDDAKRANEFQEIRQPLQEYVAVPLISSELRDYLPVARLSPDVIVNNKLGVIGEDILLAFAVLSSRPFTVWNKAVSGRLEGRLNVSIGTTYNGFPLPELTGRQRQSLEEAALGILEAREFFLGNSLADLYDARTMPRKLRVAHQALDREVCRVFGLRDDSSDEKVLGNLFDQYQGMTSGLLPAPTRRRGKA